MTRIVNTPLRIPAGGLLGAFTPSDPLTAERMKRAENGVAVLAAASLRVVFSRHALESDGHFAGSPEDRASDMMELAIDDRVHALIATCGGKSSNSLLRRLNYAALGRARKPILGFSDVGVILNAVTAKSKIVTFYGPNVLSKLDETSHHQLAALRYTQLDGDRTSAGAETIVQGVTTGRLVGGNLSTFTMSIAGTEFEPRFPETILFWEAGRPDLRLIEQCLAALEIRGVMDRIRGMLVGKIGEDAALTVDQRMFVRRRLQHYSFPILHMPVFGHGHSDNPIWPIGGLVRLDATSRLVSMLEPFVSER